MNWGRTSCFLFEMLAETTPQMFHNASIWLTLVLAVQRYIYVCQATRYTPPVHLSHHTCPVRKNYFNEISKVSYVGSDRKNP